MWPTPTRKGRETVWMGQHYGSRLPTRFNAARRDSPGSVKKLEKKALHLSSLQCGPARFAGIRDAP